MNLNNFVSLLFTLSNGKNITDISVANNEDIDKIHVSVNSNISVVQLFSDTSISATSLPDIINITTPDIKSKSVTTTDLYNNIIAGNYEEAVSNTKLLETIDGTVISDVVLKLIDANANNTMEYAYKLSKAGGKAILKKYFPPAFKAIFYEDQIRFISTDHDVAIQLSSDFTFGNPAAVILPGDLKNIRGIWRMIPVWQDDRVYFKIRNTNDDGYLYLFESDHEDITRAVWSTKNENAETNEWYINVLGFNTFSITNRKFDLLLMYYSFTYFNDSENAIWARAKDDDPWYFYKWSIIPLI